MNQVCLRTATLLVLAGAIASCGGAAMYGAKTAEEAPPPATPEAALAALDAAEAQLAGILGPSAPPALSQAPAASAAPASPPPPPPPVAPATAQSPPSAVRPEPPRTYAEAPVQPSAARDARAAEREPPKAADPCATACSALASMERAADHLCTLAGAADNRCHSARERVKNASARVQASCPACAR